MSFKLKIRPIDPKIVERREVAVHEAAHCVVAAYLGARSVSATIRGRRTYASFRTLEEVFVMSYAGYYADLLISSIPEPIARKRSTTERTRAIISFGASLDSSPARAKLLQDCQVKAKRLVERFIPEIKGVATLLEQRETLQPHEFEEIEFIKKVRAIGQAETVVEREVELEIKKNARAKESKRKKKNKKR